jgi:hypothetical protein
MSFFISFTRKHLFLYTRKRTFVAGTRWSTPWKGGWDTGAGRPNSYPNSGILIEKPMVSKAGQKSDRTKLIFKNLQTYIFHLKI